MPSEQNPYLPECAEIIEARDEANSVKTLRLRFRDAEKQRAFSFRPGQFVQVTAFGVGEAPISICSSASKAGEWIEVSAKKIGNVTHALHELEQGGEVGLRGPYGNHYPLGELEGKDIIFLAGGIGIAPLRGAIMHCLENRGKYGQISLYLGAKTPADVAFKGDIAQWRKEKGFQAFLTVDKAEEREHWHEFVGMAPALLEHYPPNPKNTAVISCGPPMMMKYAIETLAKRGFSGNDIYVSMERNMKCGIGKCGHCMARGKYVCQDGPVFTWNEAQKLEE
ncbi:MAG: FAD/NAD(P)-binding protein [Candidatus Micrarchaeia archaeon]|jgi:NAD(P)H-flavin reductase